MLNKTIIGLLFLFCFSVSGEQSIVQGPFLLKGTNGVFIDLVRNIDKSISLIKLKSKDRECIDNYAVGDGAPVIETVFFDKIKGRMKLVVLVSWDEENIKAIHYKVNVYNYMSNGLIVVDVLFSKDKNLEGYDSYSGGGLAFDLKNSVTINNYMQKTYK